jgi:DNA-binding transcriptional regulator YdaS (Cro superfamily)
LTGINAPLMSRIVNNLLPVSLESALRIDRATHGELAAELIVTNAEHAQLIIHIRGHQ